MFAKEAAQGFFFSGLSCASLHNYVIRITAFVFWGVWVYKREYIDFTYVLGNASRQEIALKLQTALVSKPRGVCLSPVIADYLLEDEHLADLFGSIKSEGILRQFVIDFPLGQGGELAKSFVATMLLKENCADELDVVANVGALVSNDFTSFSKELKPVVGLGVPVKVIVETGYYKDDNEMLGRALLWCVKIGAFAIKTSTTCVANIDNETKRRHVAFWRGLIEKEGYPIKIKASGGQRTREDIDALLAVGADIIGTSSVIA